MKFAFAALLIAAFCAPTIAAERYTAKEMKLLLSKKARDAHAQGCRQGQVWCCKKTPSGGSSCECTFFCS